MKTVKPGLVHAKSAKFHAIDAFTQIELVVVVIIIAVLLSMLWPAFRPRTHHSPRITCINHLKQLGTAYRIWANDNGDRFPAQTSITNNGWNELAASNNAGSLCWTNYSLMSNELGQATKVLVCPSDERDPAADFGSLSNINLSYFIGPNASSDHPEAFLSGDRNLGPGVTPANDYGYSPANGMGSAVFVNYSISWTLKMHSQGSPPGGGNLLLADGSAQQVNSSTLRSVWIKAALEAEKARTHATNSLGLRLLFP